MDRISVLDCTLRDGGYINDFNFTEPVIRDIINLLGDSGIQIIECGFLRSGCYDKNKSLFGSVEFLNGMIDCKKEGKMYVGMIQCGKISAEEISMRQETGLDGIRVTFHENEIEEAFALARQLKEKNYEVFIQPVGTIAYSDEELLQLIQKVNELKPYAFYLVDTLGTMYPADIRRFFYLIDHNLNIDIKMGFHAHNNLQQAFNNAQELIGISGMRSIIIDASVMGMGRGAGNLCTELICNYINEVIDKTYDAIPIFRIIDNYISILKKEFSWGYSAAYYLAGIKRCHPNYAKFLLDKQTLNASDIGYILNNIDIKKRHLFDEEYISNLYVEYKSNFIDDTNSLKELCDEIGNKDVLLVAPGKSIISIRQDASISEYYVIGINYKPTNIKCDRVFISNKKRFQMMNEAGSHYNTIVTSNIRCSLQNSLLVNYSEYLTDNPIIIDNAGLMCMNMLKKIGIKRIYIAGFDGFGVDNKKNYVDPHMALDVDEDALINMSRAIKEYIKFLSKSLDVISLTDSIYFRDEK